MMRGRSRRSLRESGPRQSGSAAETETAAPRHGQGWGGSYWEYADAGVALSVSGLTEPGQRPNGTQEFMGSRS
jgi:hypothetical protein